MTDGVVEQDRTDGQEELTAISEEEIEEPVVSTEAGEAHVEVEVRRVSKGKYQIFVNGEPGEGSFTSKRAAERYVKSIMGQEVKKPQPVEVEEISPADVGAVSEILGDLEPSAEGLDWSPVEGEEVIGRLNRIHGDLIKIEGVEFYQKSGKSNYVAYTMGPRKTVCCIYPGKKGARAAIPISDGKSNVGWLSYKITEDGISLDGATKRVRDITAAFKRYAKARGW